MDETRETEATGAETGLEAGTAGATEAGQETPEQREARLKADHERELNRYRNEVGQERKKARELEARLQALEDEKKPELERLTGQVGRIPVLEQERDQWKAQVDALTEALEAQVKADAKDLEELNKEAHSKLQRQLALLPDAGPIARLGLLREELATARKAAAEKGKTSGLVAFGGRNPNTGDGKREPTKEQQDAGARDYASRF